MNPVRSNQAELDASLSSGANWTSNGVDPVRDRSSEMTVTLSDG